MAKYNNQYAISIKPNNPNLHGLDTNYTGDGQKDIGGTGLGDIFGLDYDRNKIEQIFNEGTDAQYALMQKENQIAQNQYANNQFANQQSAIESLRSQRNEQIASGMARGLNAAQEQGTILGLQQEAATGALELANNQQLEADKIAAEYADNVAKALQESNAVKQAMAQVAAQLYEADMLGYTGELSYLGQMDANASDRYGYELGLEGTKYSADKNLEGTKYNADRNLEGTKYAADKNLEGTKYTADKNYAAAVASASRYASSSGSGYGNTSEVLTASELALKKGRELGLKGNELINYAYNIMKSNASDPNNFDTKYELWDTLDSMAVAKGWKDQTKKAWEKKQNTPTPQSVPKIPNYRAKTNTSIIGNGNFRLDQNTGKIYSVPGVLPGENYPRIYQKGK